MGHHNPHPGIAEKEVLTLLVETPLKAYALATALAAEELISLLQNIKTKTRDEGDWVTSAIRNCSQNLEMLQEGLLTTDPEKVEHGAALLFHMRKFFIDDVFHGRADQVPYQIPWTAFKQLQNRI